MGKNYRGNKELSKDQELKHANRVLKQDNDRLKRQVSSLRKQLAKVDLDRYSHIRDMVEEHLHNDESESVNNKTIVDEIKASWTCHKCSDGHLEVILYTKMGEPWYYRQCDCCPHRTKAKAWNDKVTGIFKDKDKDIK